MYISILTGGLGNQLFQFAFAYSKARSDNATLKLDSGYYYLTRQRKSLLKHFKIEEKYEIKPFYKTLWSFWFGYFKNLLYFRILKSSWNVKFDNKHQWLTDSVCVGEPSDYEAKCSKESLHGETIVCYGYFQNEKYCSKYRDELLDLIMPNYAYSTEMEGWADKIKRCESVSLHIRRGDYVAIGLTLGMKYYYDAIQYIKSQVDNDTQIEIFVFSDDLEWVKSNFKTNESVNYVSVQESVCCDIDEMMLMSMCKHNIIANSTFSWWGAWLNRNPSKVVVAPVKEFNNPGIIPKEWIRI